MQHAEFDARRVAHSLLRLPSRHAYYKSNPLKYMRENFEHINLRKTIQHSILFFWSVKKWMNVRKNISLLIDPCGIPHHKLSNAKWMNSHKIFKKEMEYDLQSVSYFPYPFIFSGAVDHTWQTSCIFWVELAITFYARNLWRHSVIGAKFIERARLSSQRG